MSLGELAERNRLRAAQVDVVRVVLVPSSELIELLAYAGIALSPPRFSFAVEHSVTDGPRYGDLADQAFTAGLRS